MSWCSSGGHEAAGREMRRYRMVGNVKKGKIHKWLVTLWRNCFLWRLWTQQVFMKQI